MLDVGCWLKRMLDVGCWMLVKTRSLREAHSPTNNQHPTSNIGFTPVLSRAPARQRSHPPAPLWWSRPHTVHCCWPRSSANSLSTDRTQPCISPSPAPTKNPFAQSIAERLDADRVQPDQRHITQRGGQLTRIFEFLFRRGGHGGAGIEKHTHRHARLDLKHLQEHLLKAHVGPPVD